MLVAVKILPSIILTETRISVQYTGQVREAQLSGEFPDPLKANFTARELFKASRPKHKAPKPRVLVNKRARRDDSDSCLPSASNEDLSKVEKSNLETEDVCTDNQVSGSDENNKIKATQTDFTRHELSSKIETTGIILSP